MGNATLAEAQGLKSAFLPKDLNGAATTGARVKLDNSSRLGVVISFAAGLAATIIANVKQHDAASAGTTKALSGVIAYYHKVGAATKFTKVEVAATDVIDVGALFGTDGGLLAFDLRDSDLDVNGGFAWASVDMDDAAQAGGRLASGEYHMHGQMQLPAYDLDL